MVMRSKTYFHPPRHPQNIQPSGTIHLSVLSPTQLLFSFAPATYYSLPTIFPLHCPLECQVYGKRHWTFSSPPCGNLTFLKMLPPLQASDSYTSGWGSGSLTNYCPPSSCTNTSSPYLPRSLPFTLEVSLNVKHYWHLVSFFLPPLSFPSPL